MDFFVKNGEEPYMQFSNFKLRNYFPHEIDKLSVLKVIQTKTFDEVGHPIEGGLYDPVLGPDNIRDNCRTCNQYERHCPGHMGHIQLAVPVFNPLLFQFTYNLLKGSCVHCHRLTCKGDGVNARMLLAQLRCFELGVEHVAFDLEAILRDKITNADLLDDDDSKAFNDVDTCIVQLANKPLSELTQFKAMPTKNSVQLKKDLITDFLRGHLFKRLQKCPLCKNRNGILRNDGARSILIDFTGSRGKSKKALIIGDDGYNEESSTDEDEKKDDKKGVEANVNVVDMTENSLDIQMKSVKNGECDKLAWRGAEVREHFRALFKNDGKLLLKLFPMLVDELNGEDMICPLDGLFLERILVPPKKFRPIRMFKGAQYEDPQTMNLRKVLEATETISAISLIMKGDNSSELIQLVKDRVRGKTINAQMHDAYLQLQLRANAIFDQDLNKGDRDSIAGIKQILEKKQGLFRMHMMGKRVNFACRSVITPDPYLDIDEIGIPDIFAKKLTFTEPVNAFNIKEMKELLHRGPHQHPGANFFVEPSGKKTMLGDKPDEVKRRKLMAKTLNAATTTSLRQTPKVLRHMRNGDMIMMNRQPSLHKPSIMGHRARVLTGQRALRMNYAPCKAYNADFDGDEMNGHLVQSHIAQTEVREIANVGSNFLVPKDATPLLGLIQDHVVSGVLLTLRDRFLNKEDFMHLVLASFAQYSKRIEIPPPTILYPKRLWTGKQVVSTIVKNCIPEGKPLINLDGKAKTPLSCWIVPGFKQPDFDMSESHVVFRKGELLVGVLDKAHFGATQFGLAHCAFELYGHRCGVQLLSCFSRLFTTYLQFHGFTLGVADILVVKEADGKRKDAVMESRTIGNQVVKTAFGLPDSATPAEIKRTLAATYCNPRGQGTDVKMLDFGMKQGIAKYNDAITKACVPTGLLRLFPQNALQLMIQSGAKGSAVNAIQISGCLGQIELEGKRMAVTVAGRTLPSFRCFDPSPRAGGYIDQRFLTGMNPQELFFHTMAGREGLIDTAVKTSRSGYLQRCIIKHLEGIRVHYDSTVRDHDGSVIQFRYGEDGMDTTKVTFLNKKTMPFLEDNLEAVTLASKPEGVNDNEFGINDTEKRYRKIMKWKKKAPKTGKKSYFSAFTNFSAEHAGLDKKRILAMWFELSLEERAAYEKGIPKKCPEAVDERYNPSCKLGALPEKMLDEIEGFCTKSKEEPNDILKRTLFWKGMRSLADPGENVGLLAAQSIGEPSTQMTLNTFHFAGRGEMNVTLGIPRLREILMTASKSIATPSASIAVIAGTPRERIDTIKRELDRVYLKQLLKNFSMEEKITLTQNQSTRRYHLRIEILAAEKREQGARHLKRSKIMDEIEKRFILRVSHAIKKKYLDITDYQQMSHRTMRQGNIAAGIDTQRGKSRGLQGPDNGDSSDEEAEGGREADAAEARLHQRHRDEAADYEGEDEERVEVRERDDEPMDSDTEDVKNEEDDENKNDKKDPMVNSSRIQAVQRLSDNISSYTYDVKSNKWCEVVFELPLRNKTKMDVSSIVEREVDQFIVHQTPGIERCVETTEQKNGKETIILQTQGVNLAAFFKHADVLDVNSVYSNDLNLILENYGVEACAKAITTEMNNVFAVYGIEVSKRHLSLTADYMTFTGQIQPFNRGAMSSSSSPLQKMTFETTMAFLREALLQGEEDNVNSPSARIVMGALPRGGTGSFDLILDTKMQSEREEHEAARAKKRVSKKF
ncbi:hypothetical protein L5515_014957 [Caenorhabditis briggsae]|uniref:DNA-directed RNA polymerase subunit n=2 Tax=Caenorhabditis briggsae TaxID=6238 RepID=A0AAE9J8P0_CAEBR|nr:hypothetical protein L5515_014957 [Caenorhabditis briggsae]